MLFMDDMYTTKQNVHIQFRILLTVDIMLSYH